MTQGRADRVVPGQGQESVWDYPRPPRMEESSRHLLIRHRGEVVAETRRALRVLETSHPPTYYIPRGDVRAVLHPRPDVQTRCEWKGTAVYYDVEVVGDFLRACAWSYPSPSARFAGLTDHLAFYAQPFEGCFVDGERVDAQTGRFYGGWITSEIVGPFKGGAGTAGW